MFLTLLAYMILKLKNRMNDFGDYFGLLLFGVAEWLFWLLIINHFYTLWTIPVGGG